MGLNEKESKLVGQLIPGEERINLGRLYKYYEKVVERQPGLTINNYNLDYTFGRSTPKRFRFMEVMTADLSKTDGILLMRTGIHGEERFSVVAFALAFPEIAAYAKEKRVGIISWVAANPWGLAIWKRYNLEYNTLKKRGEPFDGNDDAIRYQLANGRWVSVLNNRPKNIKWEWADKIVNRLPVESQFILDRTREFVEAGMLGEEKVGGGPRIKAVLDGHNDHVTEDENEEANDGLERECFYDYTFPGHQHRKMIKKAAVFLPVARSRKIDSGDGGKAWVNRDGEAIKFQGSWAELTWRLGADAVALECRQGDNLSDDKEVTRIMAMGLIDSIAEEKAPPK